MGFQTELEEPLSLVQGECRVLGRSAARTGGRGREAGASDTSDSFSGHVVGLRFPRSLELGVANGMQTKVT